MEVSSVFGQKPKWQPIQKKPVQLSEDELNQFFYDVSPHIKQYCYSFVQYNICMHGGGGCSAGLLTHRPFMMATLKMHIPFLSDFC